MKILTVSDVVSSTVYNLASVERFRDVDLVLGCGDLPSYYLEFIVSALNQPLYYVMGNHPDEVVGEADERAALPRRGAGGLQARPGSPYAAEISEEKPRGPLGCVDIDERIVYGKGLLIGGLAGSMWYNGGPNQYHESDMRLKMLKMWPQLRLNRLRYGRAIDILITHSPPFGIHDGDDLAHRGFVSLLAFMDTYAPRWLIHGHKHVYGRQEEMVTQYHQTTVINTYGYRLLDVELSR